MTTQPADDCMMDEWVRPEAFTEAVTWRWAAWRQAGRKEKEPLGHVHPHVPTSSSWAKALAVWSTPVALLHLPWVWKDKDGAVRAPDRKETNGLLPRVETMWKGEAGAWFLPGAARNLEQGWARVRRSALSFARHQLAGGGPMLGQGWAADAHTAREARDAAGPPAGTGLERRLNTAVCERDAGPELGGPEGGNAVTAEQKQGPADREWAWRHSRGTGRVGRVERVALTCVHSQASDTWLLGSCVIAQAARPGGWDGGGGRFQSQGLCVNVPLIRFAVQQKLTHHKAI